MRVSSIAILIVLSLCSQALSQDSRAAASVLTALNQRLVGAGPAWWNSTDFGDVSSGRQPHTFGHSLFKDSVDAATRGPQRSSLANSSQRTVEESQPVCGVECATACVQSTICSPCNESGRRYAVDVAASLFSRSRASDAVLFVNPASRAENVSTNSLATDLSAGIDGGLTLYEQHHLTDVEIRATLVDRWQAQTQQLFSGTTVQFNASPPVGTTGPRLATVISDSEFFSTEANLRFRSPKKCAGPTWIIGARLITFDDSLHGLFADPSSVFPNEDVRIEAENRLFGGHVGFDSVLKNQSCWCIKWMWRLGVYGNEGKQNSQLISQASPPISFPANGSATGFAWHAEAGVHARWRFSKCSSLFLGYRLMYVDGLVLAPEQLAATDFLNQRGLKSDGSLWLQSLAVGLELAF